MNSSFTKFSTTSKSAGEIVPVHDAPDVKLRVVKAARAGLSADESEALPDGGVKCFPSGRSRPGA
eukprot:7049331-Alexandrium_andersonii.AAC.1